MLCDYPLDSENAVLLFMAVGSLSDRSVDGLEEYIDEDFAQLRAEALQAYRHVRECEHHSRQVITRLAYDKGTIRDKHEEELVELGMSILENRLNYGAT